MSNHALHGKLASKDSVTNGGGKMVSDSQGYGLKSDLLNRHHPYQKPSTPLHISPSPLPIHTDNQLAPALKSSSTFNVDDMKPDSETIKMYVTQIPVTYTEIDLMPIFSEFGSVYKITLIREKMSGCSRGCCFVTYYERKSAMDAMKALHKKNTLPGGDRPIEMKIAYGDERDRTLYVADLPMSFSELDLNVMFGKFGVIEKCSILKDVYMRSRCCGFVTFESRKSGIIAIQHLHKYQLEGCRSHLRVQFALTLREKEMIRNQQPQCHNLYTAKNLASVVQNSNTVHVDVRSAINVLLTTGIFNGFNAMEQFINTSSVATLNMNSYLVTQSGNSYSPYEGAPLFYYSPNVSDSMYNWNFSNTNCSHTNLQEHSEISKTGLISANPPREAIESSKSGHLCIHNIPMDYKDFELKQLFKPFGKIVSATVCFDKDTGLSKCFGFVKYDDIKSAQYAVRVMNGCLMGEHRLRVELNIKYHGPPTVEYTVEDY